MLLLGEGVEVYSCSEVGGCCVGPVCGQPQRSGWREDGIQGWSHCA